MLSVDVLRAQRNGETHTVELLVYSKIPNLPVAVDAQ